MKLCLTLLLLISISYCANSESDLIYSKDVPVVYNVVSDFNSKDSLNPNLYMVSVGEHITLKVSGLNKLVKSRKKDLSKLVLFIDNVKIWGCYPEFVDTITSTLKFQLIRLNGEDEISKKNRDSWSQILGHPTSFKRNVTVSLGFEDGLPFHTLIDKQFHANSEYSFSIIMIQKAQFIIVSVVFIILFFYVTFYVCRKTELIRGSSGNYIYPKNNNSKNDKMPYSLSKSQLFFWFVLIVASTLYLWVVTGDYIPISDTALGILAISSLTSLSAAAVDTHKNKGNDTNSNHLKWSKNYFVDILHDENGFSLQRLQIFVWTLLFGCYFIIQVWKTLSIPDIDPSMLILMGISSGTYVGFKLPEKK